MKKFAIILALATLGVVANAQVVFQTGFEAPAFSVGPINTQNGFTTFNANASGPIISTANPKSGSQHLRLPDNPALANGTLSGAFSPVFAGGTGPQIVTRASYFIPTNDVGGADYDFIAQSVGQSQLAFRLKFEFLGTVVVVDDLDGAGSGVATFEDTGFAFATGQWNNIEVVTDYTTLTHTYKINGTTIYTGNFINQTNTSIDQVIMFSDLFHNPGVVGGDVDDVSVTVVPEPATMLALGGAVAAFMRRRRKSA